MESCWTLLGQVSRSLNVWWALCWWGRSSWCIINGKAVCGAYPCALDILKCLSSSCGFIILLVQPFPGWGYYPCGVPSKPAQKLMWHSKSVTSQRCRSLFCHLCWKQPAAQGVSEAQGYRGELTWHKVFFHPSSLLLILIAALGLPSTAPNPPP